MICVSGEWKEGTFEGLGKWNSKEENKTTEQDFKMLSGWVGLRESWRHKVIRSWFRCCINGNCSFYVLQCPFLIDKCYSLWTNFTLAGIMSLFPLTGFLGQILKSSLSSCFLKLLACCGNIHLIVFTSPATNLFFTQNFQNQYVIIPFVLAHWCWIILNGNLAGIFGTLNILDCQGKVNSGSQLFGIKSQSIWKPEYTASLP